MIAKLLRQSHLYLVGNIGKTFYECNFYLMPNKRPFFCPLYVPKRPVMPFRGQIDTLPVKNHETPTNTPSARALTGTPGRNPPKESLRDNPASSNFLFSH